MTLKHLHTAIAIIALITHSTPTTAQNKKQIEPHQLPFKEIVKRYYPQNVYIGIANNYTDMGTLSGEIALREFDYIVPSNDYKQSCIHPEPNKYQWSKGDKWLEYAQKHQLNLRLHGPISPQCSKWAKEDHRTAQELSENLDGFIIKSCKRYAANPQVKWLDVINETIAKDNCMSLTGPIKRGEWFGPAAGTTKWENPWTIMGYDSIDGFKCPVYIDRAFKLYNQHAPHIKQIINQHGNFEEEVWNSTMKGLVHYLRDDKGRRIDGIGWQAHIDKGWEKIPGNLERLSAFIDWAHANNLEFHITEMNVWIKDKVKTPEHYQQQSDTYTTIIRTVLSKHKTGVVGISFWNVRDQDIPRKELAGCLWNNDGSEKPAVRAIKEAMVNP